MIWAHPEVLRLPINSAGSHEIKHKKRISFAVSLLLLLFRINLPDMTLSFPLPRVVLLSSMVLIAFFD